MTDEYEAELQRMRLTISDLEFQIEDLRADLYDARNERDRAEMRVDELTYELSAARYRNCDCSYCR